VTDLTARQRATGTRPMRVCSGIGRVLLRMFTRADVVGFDNVPPDGPVLFAANHTHVVDGPLLFAAVTRPAVFFVKAEAFIGPLGPFLRWLGQIPVRRDVVERAPLLTALEVLASGGAVGIFPEGSRGEGTVAEVRHGIAYLAVRSGAPVVPVACIGTAAILHRRSIRRPRVRIVFGTPVSVAAGRASRSAIAGAAEQIRVAMADLVRGSSDV